MTLRYTHVGDTEIEAAAKRIGLTIARLMVGEASAERSEAQSNQRPILVTPCVTGCHRGDAGGDNLPDR